MITPHVLLSMSLFLIVSGVIFLAYFKLFTCKNLGLSFLGSGLVLLPVAIWLEFFL